MDTLSTLSAATGLRIWARIATVAGRTTPIIFSDERLPDEDQNFYRVTR